jgi:hypothetical protein
LDWTLAITRNRDQLKAIVLALFTLAGMRIGGSLSTLRRDAFNAIMLVLRPAESAVRRLILITALGLKPSTSTAKPARWPDLPPGGGPEAGETRGSPWSCEAARGGPGMRRAFKLFDPLKSFDPESIWDIQPTWESGIENSDQTFHYASTEDTPLDATHLGQRLNALMRALDNLPAQARRLVRWQARCDAKLKASKPTRISPMRPGLPPGWRERRIHEIDDVLRECHGLAHDRLNTS